MVPGSIIALVVSFIFLLIIAGFVIGTIMIYNRFQQLKNSSEATFNQIKVAMKKRLDLLSELLESVKSYASFEKETFEKVTKMRTEVMKVNTPQDLQKIDAESRRIIGNILVSVENYPNLKTSEVVKELMESARQVEDEIARLRYTYNNIAQELNTMRDTIPSNFIARMFGVGKLDYLQFEEGVEKRPSLEWSA